MNSKQGYALVRLNDGTEKYLRFTTNAFAELEDLLGLSVPKMLMDLGGGDQDRVLGHFSLKNVRAMLYAGLRGAGGRLTLAQVGDLMDPADQQQYILQICEALKLAMRGTTAAPEEGTEPDPTPRSQRPEDSTGIG